MSKIFFDKLPNELIDLILFEFTDDIELKIFFKRPNKLLKNNSNLRNLLIKKSLNIFNNFKNTEFIVGIQLSVSKCYQIRYTINNDNVVISSILIIYNQAMEYQNLDTKIF